MLSVDVSVETSYVYLHSEQSRLAGDAKVIAADFLFVFLEEDSIWKMKSDMQNVNKKNQMFCFLLKALLQGQYLFLKQVDQSA